MGVDGLAVGDREAFGAQGFEAHFIGAAGDCAFDPGRQQALEGLEQDVLHGNGERQHPVEEGRDGRKLVLEPAVTVEQRQAGGCFELPERTAIDLAAHQQLVKLAQGIAGIVGFQIVAGAEHVLAAGLPLAARDRSQTVEPSGDRRDEALLRLHVGRYRAEQRWLLLIGAVGAAKALDGGVGLPACFEQVVDAAALVPYAQIGMIGSPCAASLREDEDVLLVIHERMGFSNIG